MAKKSDQPTPKRGQGGSKPTPNNDQTDRYFDFDEPLRRLAEFDEPYHIHSALLDYYALPNRSLHRLWRKYQQDKQAGGNPPAVRLSTLKEWSAQWWWPSRVAAGENQRRIEAAAKAEQRFFELEDRAWLLSAKLFEKAMNMASWPLARADADGKIIEPMKWTAADIARLSQAAKVLGELAARAKHLDVTPAPTDTEAILEATLPDGIDMTDVDRVLESIAAKVIRAVTPPEPDPNKLDIPKPPRLDDF